MTPKDSGRIGAARNAGIDHLRIGLTALVILHHTAIAYGGSGGWYWREEPNASQPALLMFNAFNQSFFMGFFFLLAGYYTPASYERKGTAQFLIDRLWRLGVPLVVYFFVLSPLTIALARTSQGHALLPGWWAMVRNGAFGPGPLWFAEALLILAGVYVLWRKFLPTPATAVELPPFRALAFTAFLLGGVSFLVRLVIPVGQEWAWLQLGYFPCYLYLYAAGCAASRSTLLERITYAQARPWLIVSLVAAVAMGLVLFLQPAEGAFEGGWNANALFYALWDPFAGWGMMLGLLWAARTQWSQPTRLTAWLGRQAYGAFIVHPPVVVGLGLLAAGCALHPLAKFAVVGAAACATSFLVASLLRALPGVGRIL
jgi:peptidoglycan/LPS O-acetylase OafA/YrhL